MEISKINSQDIMDMIDSNTNEGYRGDLEVRTAHQRDKNMEQGEILECLMMSRLNDRALKSKGHYSITCYYERNKESKGFVPGNLPNRYDFQFHINLNGNLHDTPILEAKVCPIFLVEPFLNCNPNGKAASRTIHKKDSFTSCKNSNTSIAWFRADHMNNIWIKILHNAEIQKILNQKFYPMSELTHNPAHGTKDATEAYYVDFDGWICLSSCTDDNIDFILQEFCKSGNR